MKTVATLIVYAYTSFTTSWGPGPAIAEKFEKICNCTVTLVNAGDAGAMLSRLKLEGKDSEADVIVGIDGTQVAKYKTELNWVGTNFEMFDSAPYSFVYDEKRVSDPPRSLDDLLKTKWKGQIVLEDPRLSTAGLGFLLWVMKEKGEGAWDYFEKLKSQVKTVAPSWEMAYGMFKKNQAKLVFSYWTSPAYHIQEEKRFDIKAARFTKGHYVQKEFMTAVPGEKNSSLKKKFIEFMKGKEAQEELAKKNFMFPANKAAKLTPAMRHLGTVRELKSLPSKDLEHLEEWLKKWRDIFS